MSPQRLVRLYPAAWRHRYGEEFLAVLEARPLKLADIVDIAHGALDAHLRPQAPLGRFQMATRLTGLAAIGAGAALLTGFLRPLVPGINEVSILVFYLLAPLGLVGIHLRHLAVHPGLAWVGFVLPFLGVISGIAFVALTRIGIVPTSGGDFGYLASIALWIGAAALGAAILTFRAFPAMLGIAFVMSAPLAMIDPVARSAGVTSDTLALMAQVGIGIFTLAWFGVGWSLLTTQPDEGVLGPAT